MSKAYPMVPLGEVLIESEERADVDPGACYRQVTVRLWGKGVALRGEIAGSDIAVSKQFIVRTNQFILSKIDARNGAFGLIPASLDGAIVSPDFPVFTLNNSRIIPEFLHWMSKTSNFIELCKAASEGTTNRIRLKIDRFLATKIPLPSLEEQQRIVARIEELAAKIEEARGLQKEAVEEAERVMAGVELQIWPDKTLEKAVCLEEVTTFLSRGRQSAQGDSEHYLIKTQHVQQGRYIRSHITLSPEVATRVQPDAMVQTGDILIACSAAGCLGRVAQFMEPDQVASTDTHVAIARANSQIILPAYLYAYLKGTQGQVQLRSREEETGCVKRLAFD